MMTSYLLWVTFKTNGIQAMQEFTLSKIRSKYALSPIYIYIYIYTWRERERERELAEKERERMGRY